MITHTLTGTNNINGKKVYIIKSIPKPEAPVVWGMQILKIREDNIILSQEFFDEEFKSVKKMTGFQIQMLGGKMFPRVWRMQKTDAKDKYTELVYKELAFKQKLEDSLFTISYLRNPRRTVLTISAIAFASSLLIFMLSFQFGSYEALINSSVKIHAGHLKVQAKGYHNKRDMHLVVPDPSVAIEILDKLQGIDAYTFRANAFSLISSRERTYGVVVTGIDPAREANVSTLAKLIRHGSYLSEKDTDKALLGQLLVKNLQLDLGNELIILGQGQDGSIAATVVQVKGIYNSGIEEFDRNTIHIPLKTFQDVYSMHNSVHEVVVVCRSLKDVSTIKKKFQEIINSQSNKSKITILDWQELMPGLLQGIQMDLISGIIFYVILILIVAFSILNTFLMAIFERTREFGVLMAIGTTPGRLTKIVLLESMSMTILGIIAGIIIGIIITFYFQVNGIDIYGSSEILSQFGISGRIHPRLSMLSVFSGPFAVLLITFLAALYPALKIRGLRPVEAITYV